MPHVGSEIDAHFYELIHQVLSTSRDGDGPDRRSEKRRPYPAAQRIARWDGSKFPDEDQFAPIQCHDLTRSGFSFLISSEPRFRTFVVEFGVPPHGLYLVAQVLHSVPVISYPSGAITRMTRRTDVASLTGPNGERGTPMFLVGCRFTRRLRRPS